ncbi:MAG: hypothetical protein LBU04_01405 [Christensenellaceae bacterium]|jgi:hypothetical protein|nr:hypothetical protein [Christensenellaceae bacterium]
MKFLDDIATFMKEAPNFLKVGELFMIAIYIVCVSVLAIVLIFLIANIVSSFSKKRKLATLFNERAKNLIENEMVDDDNVALFNRSISNMPESVKRGWSGFLSCQTEYPSNYITEYDIVNDPTINFKKQEGKSFFHAFGFLVILLGLFLFTVQVKDLFISDISSIARAVITIIGGIFIPILVYVLISSALRKKALKQETKLVISIRNYLDALDNNVLLYREPWDEFSCENIEEVDAQIERILAGKFGDDNFTEMTDTYSITDDRINEFLPKRPAPDDNYIYTDPIDAVLFHDLDSFQTDELDDIQDGQNIVNVTEDIAIDEIVSEAVIEQIVTAPIVDDVIDETAVDEIVANPIVDDVIDEITVDEIVANPVIDETVLIPMPDVVKTSIDEELFDNLIEEEQSLEDTTLYEDSYIAVDDAVDEVYRQDAVDTVENEIIEIDMDTAEDELTIDELIAVTKEPLEETSNIAEPLIENKLLETLETTEQIAIEVLPSEIVETINDSSVEPALEEESVLASITLAEGEEDISSDLFELVQAVDAAVSDPITTVSDLETLTIILDDARNSGFFERKIEQDIFDICFGIVAEIFFDRLEESQ